MNLFGSTKDIYIYIYIYIYCGLPVGGTKKKKREKKNFVQETGMGYCLFSFCAGSRYSTLYHDTAG